MAIYITKKIDENPLFTEKDIAVSSINVDDVIDEINSEYGGRYRVISGIYPSFSIENNQILITFECEVSSEKKDGPLPISVSNTKMPDII